MKTVNVSLTEQLGAYVQRKLNQGSYASVSEVVREALREMQAREESAEEVRAAIRDGLASGKGRTLKQLTAETIAQNAGKHRKPTASR